MGIMDMIFGQGRSQGNENPPVNPTYRDNPNDPALTNNQRQIAKDQQSQQQPNPGQTNTPVVGQQALNNQAPGGNNQQQGNQQQGNQSGQTSPLDDFSKIWETNSDPKAQANKKFSYPKFDNAKLQERVGQMNFASSIPDELLTKAMNGDMQSFRDALNHVGRQSFQTGFSATNALNSQVFNSFDQSVDERIPQQVRGLQNQQAVMGELKSLNHPAVAPLLNNVTQNIQQMYPDAGPDEIKEYAKKYMVTMAQLITGQIKDEDNNSSGNAANNMQQNNSSQNRGVTDFSNWN